jgi:catechol 2,3-dioxygenase-like lactoylglutathione lyase family enzyme
VSYPESIIVAMIGQLQIVVIDCPDPRALASFYGELLGMRRIDDEDDWVTIGSQSDRAELAFQRAPELRAPRWPDPEFPQQFHLDVEVGDIEEAEPKVLKLGATPLPGGGKSFRVYADPVGHPFCLVW